MSRRKTDRGWTMEVHRSTVPIDPTVNTGGGFIYRTIDSAWGGWIERLDSQLWRCSEVFVSWLFEWPIIRICIWGQRKQATGYERASDHFTIDWVSLDVSETLETLPVVGKLVYPRACSGFTERIVAHSLDLRVTGLKGWYFIHFIDLDNFFVTLDRRLIVLHIQSN
jgi:hypothetical protein